ncbi:MAG: short-chain dehydrogenase/reductase SDR [Halothiobacillaceae bacterium]|nr:MAG: short-chain dehydrogenase/reductase SDR [Halothiobacillaceae bacterium]
MKLNNCRALVTGATGGIGRHLALALAQQGARVVLVGRRREELGKIQAEITHNTGVDSYAITVDIASAEGRNELLQEIWRTVGGIDLLINNAGISDFHAFSEQDPEVINNIFQTNLIAPVQLTRALLPGMLALKQGRIVNIGSVFGSIGFAYFTAYSSSKFAMRGFSEALRRELADTGVGVSYIGPRAVRTAANSAAVYRMAEAINMQMDEPQAVASFIIQAIQNDTATAYYGWPEKLFVRLNALFPRWVDSALKKQNRLMAQYLPQD